jgi:hypothetical protein
MCVCASLFVFLSPDGLSSRFLMFVSLVCAIGLVVCDVNRQVAGKLIAQVEKEERRISVRVELSRENFGRRVVITLIS